MWRYAIFFLPLATSGHAAIQTVTPNNAADTTLPFHPGATTQSYMIITPTARAQDFQQAYETLKKEKSAGKVYFQLADGSKLFNVIEMTLMPNSTLVLFRLNSQQGINFQIVRIEDIATINY